MLSKKELTKTNIQALLDNIKRNSSSSSERAETAESDSEPVLLAVKRFVFESSNIQLLTEEWGDTTLKLPAIELTNLGSAERGLTPEQLAEKVTKPLMDQIKRHVSKELETLAKDRVEEKAREALQEQIDKNLSGSRKRGAE